MDMNTKKLKKNAFRVTKHRGVTASRVRVPGGRMDANISTPSAPSPKPTATAPSTSPCAKALRSPAFLSKKCQT